MSTFLLVHSPLVGPYTWEPVADELRHAGHTVAIARLTNDPTSTISYLDQHKDAILSTYENELRREDAILVGHSGAGMILPYAGATLPKLAGYIFVDADIPRNKASRLDHFKRKEAKALKQRAEKGYIPLPFWSSEVLERAIPDEESRRKFESELQPVPLRVYKEPIPVPRHWPDAPVAYLRFSSSATYESVSKEARKKGWLYAELPGYHFQMLVDPAAVAETLASLAEQINSGWRPQAWTK